MFPGTEPPILCKAQSRWTIIHTPAWAISQTLHTYTHVLFTIHAALLAVSHSASPEALVMPRLVLRPIYGERAVGESLTESAAALQAPCAFNTHRQNCARQWLRIPNTDDKRAEVREKGFKRKDFA